MTKTIAGIVTFEPDIKRLKENIEAIYNQVNEVVIVENGSSNRKDIISMLNAFKDVSLICNDLNKGIAEALNQMSEYAANKGYKWLLTLDQDSVVFPQIISKYEAQILENERKDIKAAILTCIIVDRNFQYEDEKTKINEYESVDFCITSGSYLNLLVWKQVHGFDEKMFIDKVDTDYCQTVLENGYSIIKINYKGLLHEVGNHTRSLKVLGRKVIVFNHSSFRAYFIIRNGIYFARKHRHSIDFWKTYRAVYHRIIIFVLFEDEKMKKLRASIKGLIDGYRMNIRQD